MADGQSEAPRCSQVRREAPTQEETARCEPGAVLGTGTRVHADQGQGSELQGLDRIQG